MCQYRTVTAWSLVAAQGQVFADLCSYSDNSVPLMEGRYFEKRSPLDLLWSQVILQHSDCVISPVTSDLIMHLSRHGNRVLCVSAVCELAVMIHKVLDGFQREEFPTHLEELQPQLQGLVHMCDELIQNSSLRVFLTLILQIGNCVNAVSLHLRCS